MAIAIVLLILRQPDRIVNAQFWAEDGVVFYSNAYNLGPGKSIFMPYAGYLNTVPAMIAAVTQPFPLQWAPVIFNLLALLFQSLPVLIITSSRCADLAPSLSYRLLLAFLYVGVTNSTEIHGTVTNTQWTLGLLSCLIVLSIPSAAIAWRIFDGSMVVLTALSGPFAMFVAPIAVVRWWSCREKWLLTLGAILASGTVIQLAVLAFAVQSRPEAALEATPILFAKIFGGQVLLGGLVGSRGLDSIASNSIAYSLLTVVMVIGGMAAIVHVLRRAPLELRLFVLFSALVFGASLALAGVSWNILWRPGSATRYWFLPILAWSASLVWFLSQHEVRWLRRIAAVLLLLMGMGIALDWRHPALPDRGFRKYANQFDQMPSGKTLVIPITPAGWSISLTKH